MIKRRKEERREKKREKKEAGKERVKKTKYWYLITGI